MSNSLTGRKRKDTYTWLLQMQGDGTTLDEETPTVICFGDGTETPLSLTTTGLFVNGVAVGGGGGETAATIGQKVYAAGDIGTVDDATGKDAFAVLDQSATPAGSGKRWTLFNFLAWIRGLAHTWSGVHAFTGTTRPTSAGTGTPEATSLITRDDGDARYSLAKASAYKSTDQLSLTTGAYNKVTFDTEDYDVGSCFASSTWTAPYACKVLVTTSVLVSGTAGVDALAVYKNGSAHKRVMNKTITASELIVGSCVVNCAAGNTLDIYYYSQNARSIVGAATVTWVQFTVIP